MQKILNGINNLSIIVRECCCKGLFLVIDSSYPYLSIKGEVESLQIMKRVYFSDFTSNPLYEQVCKGIDLFRASDCDTILAIGGGSAIDVAKCIKLAVLAHNGRESLIPPIVNQAIPIDGTRIPFIAIPTTAGTGSESTHNAVMYYEGSKQTVTNDGILPDYAILEPEVLKSLPLYQKKCTMMDALCQGIESWWSINSTKESIMYSHKAISLVMANWEKYIFENDSFAASQIMLAANFSGRAINIAQTTAAHAMSYKITSLYKLPHGHAVAVCLPEIWDYMKNHMDQVVDTRGAAFIDTVFNNIATAMGMESVLSAIECLRHMMKDMGLEKPISHSEDVDLNVLVSSVNPIRLKNNPVVLDKDTIHALYDSIIS